ncbi:MAG: hypothetical protein RL609_390 [Bacteroidota bacterium]|jgi:ribosomal protein S18 acetylase RimI-like enzyme
MGEVLEVAIRNATDQDIPFIVETIIQAERSGTQRCALIQLFQCTETELRNYLTLFLKEEMTGCEWSVDSFMIAEYDGNPVGAFGAWIEGQNEWDLSSVMLKSNLMKAHLPITVIQGMLNFQSQIVSVAIPRNKGALQLEYAYVVPHAQGKGIVGKLIEHLVLRAEQSHSEFSAIEVQVFSDNRSAVRAYEKLGFVCTFETEPNEVENLIFPFNRKIKMTKSH